MVKVRPRARASVRGNVRARVRGIVNVSPRLRIRFSVCVRIKVGVIFFSVEPGIGLVLGLRLGNGYC
jgi:hypothetical protein